MYAMQSSNKQKQLAKYETEWQKTKKKNNTEME